MSLSSAYAAASAALSARQAEISTTSRNISNANTTAATKKTTDLATSSSGTVTVLGVSQATGEALFEDYVEATSEEAYDSTVLEKLDELQETVGDTEDDISVSSKIGDLISALELQASDPSDEDLAEDTVEAAKAVAEALNDASEAVDDLSEACDEEIEDCVDTINDLLSQFEDLNTTIVAATKAGKDVTDLLDQRNALLLELSEQIGITTVSRDDNDMVVYTDSGAVLFETYARTVSIDTTGSYSSGDEGAAILVDGVAITGSGSTMAISGGTLAGLVYVRDEVCPAYQNKLDEIARALIEAFAETADGEDDACGLFSWSGGPDIPDTATLTDGIAASITVNSAVDPDEDGDVDLLRDGGINGDAYIQNSDGDADYSDILEALLDALDEDRSYDSSVSARTSGTVLEYANSVISWLEDARSDASDAADASSTTLSTSSTAYSNKTGINIDDELQSMMEIENGYAAAAKLLTAIDGLFDTLIANIG